MGPVFSIGNGDVLWSICQLDCTKDQSRHSQRHAVSRVAQLILEHLVHEHIGSLEKFKISKEPSGRPIVELAGSTLMASISHSRNLVCAALGCNSQFRVGIDVEFHEPGRNVEDISHTLKWLDAGLSAGSFYREWCLYEARYKATGVLARDEQPDMHISQLEVPDNFTGMLVWDRKRWL